MSRIRGVFSVGEASGPEGAALAQRFAVPHFDTGSGHPIKLKHLAPFIRESVGPIGGDTFYVFLVSERPLSLFQLSSESKLSLSADLSNPKLNYRRLKGGGKQQMLAKAVGLGASTHLRVIDATAGFGRDAFILASLGASVQMVERVSEVRALLESALDRAQSAVASGPTDFAETIKRLSLEGRDAVDLLAALTIENRPDVIYLDPMFPPRQKSALVKKEMRVLHDFVGANNDADQLFEAARATGVRRIVVKRPRIAPTLSDAKPSHVFSGKSNRFDIYLRT